MPVGGGGLVPNLLAGNVDAAVVYSPLSFQIAKSGEARTILDYAKEVPPNLTAGWIAPDKYAQEKPQMVQKTLNALYGALAFMRGNKDTTVKLIADLYEIPPEIAALEYENTIMKLETDGSMGAPNTLRALQLSLDMAKARRHEGSGAGGRHHVDAVQAGSDQALRQSAMAATLGGKAGAHRHRGGGVRAVGNPVADRHRQSAPAAFGLRYAGHAVGTAAARQRAQRSRGDGERGADRLRRSPFPVGALIGFLIAENRYFAEVAKPLLFFAFSIPKSIFLPMFILVFGVGFSQKVGFGFFSTIFIVIMSTTTAVESVKVEHLTVARSYGATPLQTAFRVYLPSMLPVLLEALRISMIFNLTGVILAEMYASRDGIGHQIATWGENFQMKQLLAGVVMIAAIAMTFNELVRSVETRCSHWRT